MIPIKKSNVYAFRIPTATPEADGTLEWSATGLILVELFAADKTGLGYTYADTSTAIFIKENLLPLLSDTDCLNIDRLNARMTRAIRNNGTCGIAMMAVSAV